MGCVIFRALVGAGVIVAAVLLFVVVSSTIAQPHPGGDPDGAVLHTMKGIRAAVPPEATHVSVRTYPTQWVPGCPEITKARSGWDKETVYVTFSDRDPTVVVEHQIASALQKSGWSSSPMRITEGQGLVPHWLRMVRGAQPIDAFAYAVPAGSIAWFLTASWQPHPGGQGCP
jgi:hypothetical protein